MADVEMTSYGVIEMPVIALLAGLMILAGFMEELGAFESIAHFIQHPFHVCLFTDTGGGVTCGVRFADSARVWNNVLVTAVLVAMTALFLLGPTLGQLDVGGIAFTIGLGCLTGLGIWSARTGVQESGADVAAAAGAMARSSTSRESHFNTIQRVTRRLDMMGFGLYLTTKCHCVS